MQNFFSQFTGWVDGSGQILTQTFQGAQVVGVTFAKFQEAQKLAEEATAKAEAYHKQLIEAGVIKPRLTPEEQIAALTAQMSQLASQNAALSAQVQSLTEVFTEPKKGGA